MKDTNSYDQIYQLFQKSRKNPILVEHTPNPFIFTNHVLENYLITSLIDPELWIEFVTAISMANAGNIIGFGYTVDKYVQHSGSRSLISASACADMEDATNDSLMKWFEIMQKPSSQFMLGLNFQVSQLLGWYIFNNIVVIGKGMRIRKDILAHGIKNLQIRSY
jgi:hypothetical protein